MCTYYDVARSDKWISVAERLPEYGKKVAVLAKSTSTSNDDLWHATGTYCCRGIWSGFENIKIVYWYPLPEFPK